VYPQVFGKYVLEREISRGGMARLCLATLRGASGFEKKLVVKQIRDELAFDDQWVGRFVEEAKTTVALSHPNIVPVYELGIEQGIYFLAMELVEGVSLAELLKVGESKLSPEEGAYLGAEVCRALDYAHRRVGVVHRDVTPRNVMIDEEGQIKVIDFGIAAPARVAGHEVFGSPGHMPPEQIDGKALGPPTDVFAVAVLLMEAWSGVAPFRRPTVAECDEAMRRPHPKPSEADPRLAPLDEIIGRAMRLDPKERPQAADELGRALRKFLSGTDTSDIARGLGERVRSARAKLRAAAKEAKAQSSRGGAFRASQASYGELQTKTFAARAEVEKLTPPPMQPVGAIPELSTRKMAVLTPPPGEVIRPSGGTPASPASEPRVDVPPETIATRPLETPVKAFDRQEDAEHARGKRTRLLVGVGTIALGAAAFLAFKTREPPGGSHPVKPVATTIAATATGAATSIATGTAAGTAAGTTTSTAMPTTATATTVGASTSTSGGTGSASAGVAAKARLALYGDPGTRVTVDGVPRGACPVQNLAIEAGTHEVRFTFDPTGESRGERIEVRPGERVTLRADFTGAIPTIRVQR
jgi:serine/threonine-protein kinase